VNYVQFGNERISNILRRHKHYYTNKDHFGEKERENIRKSSNKLSLNLYHNKEWAHERITLNLKLMIFLA
jgi:hypothetical protein